MATKKAITFETRLEQLNHIVEQLENGKLPLDTALKTFAEGITLSRECEQTLQQAEQQVKILINHKLTDFSTPAD